MSRLPVPASLPSRGGELARGVGALVGTLLIVVGVPLALIAAFGSPWPTSGPDSGWITAPITANGLLSVLAVVVWLAWVHFVICLVVELVADRRARGLAPRVPGGGIGTQSLARRLVAAIVLIAGSASVSISSASAATMHSGNEHVTHARTIAAPELAASHEDALGLPSAGDLSRATKQDQKAQSEGQVTYYDVKPPSGRNYDTLWDIAERYLGDGLRYKEIYDLNRGVTQPDGRVLGSADLIYPGWVMRMPSDAHGPGLKVIDHASTAPTDPRPNTADGAGSSPTAHEQTTTYTAPDAEPTTASRASSSDQGTSAWAPVFGVAGGLAIAGAALGLRRRRAGLRPAALWGSRQAAASGGPEPDGPGPHGPVPPTPGASLRDEADPSTAGWISRALRSWNDGHGPVPATTRCSVTPGGLAVAFVTSPERPAPDGWRSSADDRVWTIDRPAEPEGAGLAPIPGLVTIGRRDDDSLLLIDLEAIPGLVSLGGDPTAARSVAMSVAIDTATHAWADDRTVTLVGFADDLSAVGGERIRAVDDIERVIESLGNIAKYQRSACRRADTVSIRNARAVQPANDAWHYELVVCSGVPSPAAVAALSDLAADQQVSLGVVVVGDCPEAAARFAVSADGRLSSGFLGVDVRAQQLSVSACRSLVSLFDSPNAPARVDLDAVSNALGAESDLAAISDDSARIRIDVLGPVTVTAESEPDEDRRDLLTELAAYLAVHPAGVHANLISAALWPRGVDPETRDAALGQVAQWLTVDGVSALHHDAGIWRLDRSRVAVDWDTFRSALNHASEQPRARESILRGALSLVRGTPFEAVPEHRYSWLGGDPTEDDIRLAVGLTARTVAESAAGRDDAVGAREALLRGLSAVPASEELWGAALRLADRFGGSSDAKIVADQMYAAIGAHGSPMGASAQTDALVDEILPGYRTRAA